MRLPRLVLVVLLFFVAGMVSVTASEVWRSVSCADQISHADGSPCPDPDHSGHPCGPACACKCCPGHAPATMVVPQHLEFAPPASEELSSSAYDALHPKDVRFRIFHPPRA